MIKDIEILVPPEFLAQKNYLANESAYLLELDLSDVTAAIPIRRSIDSRGSKAVYRVLTRVFINEKPQEIYPKLKYEPVRSKENVIIVGSGPSGLFAALKLIELGIKPIIIERGGDVQARRKDLRSLQQDHIVNPNSNYCFGEGGAGTYSDGKLYTRSTKRGDVKKILQVFVQHGAKEDILIDSHPHIGSNKLPLIVKAMRETIIKNGGEVHFNSLVTDLIIKEGKILGVVADQEKEILGDCVILATGHSARDMFYLLHKKNIKIEAKDFAMGVRIEHPQALINEIQYHTKEKNEFLPSASYSLSIQVDGRGVYSFCMCPGGIIVPAATLPGEIVVNGMSLSKRNSPFANSGLVVSVNSRDWKKKDSEDPFAGLKFQQDYERQTFEWANKTQSAPAQRVTDFLKGKDSQSLPRASYIPGLTASPLHQLLPPIIRKTLQKALIIFDRRMKGYVTDEAIIVAAESRTSSPVRVIRDKETYMHPQVNGLFPCGEGAGYAGGIVSSAMDGENVAEALFRYLKVS
ncbi:MAG: FAD-binding protein [Ignavibacteria bacterium RIFOXYB2_FULL_35_12]|nr:MAG: FAD-binding protein [Ignavibacteria bacterium GWA2_36_19]OGU60078.1 MAG: FAD-binding protein [Ignavibacteria bacterium GWF2_35_20]OGU83923.1 MAG: FAD-binding protein [Ignavibacteria bacterium RIFOXYA12_FULL_35_25]OGU88176.1 MAG: FAD-binding protein [Ignavibacteria bacterium RIFOXYC12_FULL_35_11]OGU94793.1 MAG: FAD-binding protein [Ignavibacteria bacterium RIFOXYB12_FULL_35_14]OGU98679.1 MAG: FAD-binding protein [Ignavibacteria bacterium RIFOXYC2_FULL_35_16]OGV02163.1 MAG: FAD-binding 